MSESRERPQSPSESGSKQASQPQGEAFRQADKLVAADNEESGGISRRTFEAIEDRETRDRGPNLTDDSDSRRISDDKRDHETKAERKAGEAMKDALDEKAREEGVQSADDTSRGVWDLTAHNT